VPRPHQLCTIFFQMYRVKLTDLMKTQSRDNESGPHDFTVVAPRVVEAATGQRLGGTKVWKDSPQTCRTVSAAPVNLPTESAEESASSLAALTTVTRTGVVRALIRRNSLRSTVRLTGVPKNRIKALIMNLGPVCTQYQDEVLQHLPAGELEWSQTLVFRAKSGITPEKREYLRAIGPVWTCACLDTRTKLVPSWRIGPNNSNTEAELHEEIAHRYGRLDAARSCLGGFRGREHLGHICPASFVRPNAGFARKVERHAAALALYLMYYNFLLIHQELGTTPAVASAKASRVWRVEDLVGLLDGTIRSA
jgi:hypothetical protein